jgi:NAD(P)-dependent dehydrogenase (short-subunit alcohol dehydrogenase family)
MTLAHQYKIPTTFGPRSTTADVLADIDLGGQAAVVTGGYSGLGLEITRAFTEAGAHVVIPARRPDVARAALAGISNVEVVAADLADLSTIEQCAQRIVATGRPIEMVVCNAGIMACPATQVGNGWEAQFAINHLGHYALVNHLQPALSPAGARIVSVSSAGHFLSEIRWNDLHFNTGYDRWVAYGQSKTANALFATHLNSLGKNMNIQAFSLHPGSILTPLQRHVSIEEQHELGWRTEDGQAASSFKSPSQGAATAVWAATSPQLARRGGEYCQDCDIAEHATTDDMDIGGVKPWAIDPQDAAHLWTLSAQITGIDNFSRTGEK